MKELKNKNILIGISGSIAAYKTCEIIRFLRKEGANTQAIMTKSSQEFKNEQAKFVAQWKKVKQYTGVNTQQQFVKNVSAAFDGKRSDYAHSKLMQLDLLSKLASKSIEKQELILTSLAYLAQKKGQVFGPFGKLY